MSIHKTVVHGVPIEIKRIHPAAPQFEISGAVPSSDKVLRFIYIPERMRIFDANQAVPKMHQVENLDLAVNFVAMRALDTQFAYLGLA